MHTETVITMLGSIAGGDLYDPFNEHENLRHENE